MKKVFCNECSYLIWENNKPYCKSNPDITWWGGKWTSPKEKNTNNDCVEYKSRTILKRLFDPKQNL